MIHHFSKRYFYYGIVILIGCVIGISLLRANLQSTKPDQDTAGLGEVIKEGVHPTVSTDQFSVVTSTPILALTQTPQSLIQTVMPMTITAPIYLLASESITTTEVWKLSPDDGQWTMLHSISKAIDKPENVIIPPEEIERMENYIKTLSLANDGSSAFSFRRYPMWLVLSPPTQQLAYLESYLTWVTDDEQGLFGITQIGSSTLETEQSHIFFQVPVRVLIEEDYYGTDLSKPLWSPNAQYFSITYNVNSYTVPDRSTPLVININTSIVHQLETVDMDSFLEPLVWSPDSKTLILYLYRSDSVTSGDVIRRCNIETLSCRDIELEGVWFYSGADWSSHRNQIVFSGANERFNTLSDPALYVFDPETDTIHKIIDNFDSSKLENPRWSLDGRFIAVISDYKTGTVASPSSPAIVVVEPDTGQIVTEIPFEGCDWQWEQSGQPIIQVLCNKIEGSYLENFNIFDTSSQTIELPDALQGKRRLGFNTLRLP